MAYWKRGTQEPERTWFPHHVFNLVEFTNKDRFVYHCWMNADKLNIFCKTANMLEIKREQLWILTNLVHLKTGAIIVTCSQQINKNFLNHRINSFDKKMLLLFQNKIQLHRKTVAEMSYIDQHENIDLIQKKLWEWEKY